jgi:hypothetical protein
LHAGAYHKSARASAHASVPVIRPAPQEKRAGIRPRIGAGHPAGTSGKARGHPSAKNHRLLGRRERK